MRSMTCRVLLSHGTGQKVDIFVNNDNIWPSPTHFRKVHRFLVGRDGSEGV